MPEAHHSFADGHLYLRVDDLYRLSGASDDWFLRVIDDAGDLGLALVA